MAAPFFQGNIQDLLKIAGTGQGSYVLGQMLDRQRRAEEADISTSILNQEAKRAEMQRAGEMHPFNMQKIKAEIDRQIADKYHTEAQTTGLKFKNEADMAAGGPEAAGKAIQTQRAGVEFDQGEKKRKAYEDEIAGMEWSPNLKDRLHSLHNKYQVDPNEAAFNYGQITSKESWDAYRQALYNASAKAREQAQKDAAAYKRATDVAQIGADSRVAAAAARQAKAATMEDQLAKAKKAHEKYAILNDFAKQAELEGDMERARQLRARAQELYPQAKKELEKAFPGLDTEALLRGEIRNRATSDIKPGSEDEEPKKPDPLNIRE